MDTQTVQPRPRTPISNGVSKGPASLLTASHERIVRQPADAAGQQLQQDSVGQQLDSLGARFPFAGLPLEPVEQSSEPETALEAPPTHELVRRSALQEYAAPKSEQAGSGARAASSSKSR